LQKDALAGKIVKGLDKNDLKELKNYMEALEATVSLARVQNPLKTTIQADSRRPLCPTMATTRVPVIILSPNHTLSKWLNC
jgi:uncharacterized protein YueI